MSEYEMELRDFGMNDNQIEIIREILTEKVVGEYFSPDEYYPADPVEFLQAWEHEKDIGDFGELRIAGRDDYLIVADENPYRAGEIMPEINARVEAAGEMLCSVMPKLREMYIDAVDFRDFQESDEKAIVKAMEMLEDGYYAADILTYVHKAVILDNPDMPAEEVFQKSTDILRFAEKAFYDEPIKEPSLVAEFYETMKEAMLDFREMVQSLDGIKAKGREALQRFLGEKDYASSQDQVKGR